MINEVIIRKAEIEDIPLIMQFIQENWKKNHILARDREFFDWMYVDKGGCNFIIAIDENNKIWGIEGVIKYNSSETPDISGTIWKTLKTDNPCLGLDISNKMYEIYHPRCGISLGLSKKAIKIHQVIGDIVGKLSHYYILGKCSEYKIAMANQKTERISLTSKKKFVPIESEAMLRSLINDKTQRTKRPYKDEDYIVHRYWEHPRYHYDIWGIQDEEGAISSLIVGRSVSCNEAKAYRMIDFIGNYDDLRKTASCFYQLVDEGAYEYIDLYCHGIPDDIVESMGFVERIQDEVIIPTYFSPFERKNVDIYYMATQAEGLNVFRGDSDQDRPN